MAELTDLLTSTYLNLESCSLKPVSVHNWHESLGENRIASGLLRSASGARAPFERYRPVEEVAMVDPFPEEHEFIGFFGVEPTLTDPDLPWLYNDVTFELEVEGRPFAATVNGGYGDLDIRWGASGSAVVSMTLREIRGLRVMREHGSEWLVADFRDAASLGPLRLQITPVFRLLWASGDQL